MANNYIQLGDEVLIDLRHDTITPEMVLPEVTFHGSDGEIYQGALATATPTKDGLMSKEDKNKLDHVSDYIISSNTTAKWQTSRYVPRLNEIIVYTDYGTNEDEKPVPMIKIGDGYTGVNNLPFINEDTLRQLSELGLDLDNIADTINDLTEDLEEIETDLEGIHSDISDISDKVDSIQGEILGGTHYIGETTTALFDGSTASSIWIVDKEVAVKSGDIAIYGKKEYIFSDTDSKWHEFGLEATIATEDVAGVIKSGGDIEVADDGTVKIVALDEKFKPDWDENNPAAEGYIQNRTHYREPVSEDEANNTIVYSVANGNLSTFPVGAFGLLDQEVFYNFESVHLKFRDIDITIPKNEMQYIPSGVKGYTVYVDSDFGCMIAEEAGQYMIGIETLSPAVDISTLELSIILKSEAKYDYHPLEYGYMPEGYPSKSFMGIIDHVYTDKNTQIAENIIDSTLLIEHGYTSHDVFEFIEGTTCDVIVNNESYGNFTPTINTIMESLLDLLVIEVCGVDFIQAMTDPEAITELTIYFLCSNTDTNIVILGAETETFDITVHVPEYRYTTLDDHFINHDKFVGKIYGFDGGEVFNDYRFSIATGSMSHAEGYSVEAKGNYSHAEGYNTVALGVYQHVQGIYNIPDEEEKYAHIVGNGTYRTPANIHTLDWNGNAWFAGEIEDGQGNKLSDKANAFDVAQSDWDENNSESPAYIKNRTHYKTPKENVVYTIADGMSTSPSSYFMPVQEFTKISVTVNGQNRLIDKSDLSVIEEAVNTGYTYNMDDNLDITDDDFFGFVIIPALGLLLNSSEEISDLVIEYIDESFDYHSLEYGYMPDGYPSKQSKDGVIILDDSNVERRDYAVQYNFTQFTFKPDTDFELHENDYAYITLDGVRSDKYYAQYFALADMYYIGNITPLEAEIDLLKDGEFIYLIGFDGNHILQVGGDIPSIIMELHISEYTYKTIDPNFIDQAQIYTSSITNDIHFATIDEVPTKLSQLEKDIETTVKFEEEEW